MSWSASKSVHGPFKRNTWDSSSPPSNAPSVSAGFHGRKLWKFLFLALDSWAGELGVGFPHSSGKTSTPEIFLPIFNHHTWEQPTSHLSPSCHLAHSEPFSTELAKRLSFDADLTM